MPDQPDHNVVRRAAAMDDNDLTIKRLLMASSSNYVIHSDRRINVGWKRPHLDSWWSGGQGSWAIGCRHG